MKRNRTPNKRERELELRLKLVRTTVRELTSTELARVDGGDAEKPQADRNCVFWPFTG